MCSRIVKVTVWLCLRFSFKESLVVVLEDMLVFLQEKDQKFSLLSLDQKVSYRIIDSIQYCA
jgi:hypothetical protein